MRRALMPTFLASLFRQWSLVSSHERGPPMATSMGRALSRADAADIALASAEFDDFPDTACSMVGPMSEAEDRRSLRTERLGDVLRRVAGKLAAQRNKRPPVPQDTGGGCPAREESGAKGRRGRVKGVGVAAPPNTGGDANAARPRRAIDGSRENGCESAVIPDRVAGRAILAPRPGAARFPSCDR